MPHEPKKKNIVLLTDCLIDPNAGGAERNIFALAKNLEKSRYRITIASMDCEGTSSLHAVHDVGCNLKIFKVKRIYGWSGLKEGIRFYQFLQQ
ncbi:MAG: hypothetical protein NUV91_05015, partial [Candidatus Omnitrophica bacterium]|nr:hypothetical protein [Candidatus Omnitrophota bacterium]